MTVVIEVVNNGYLVKVYREARSDINPDLVQYCCTEMEVGNTLQSMLINSPNKPQNRLL